MSSSTQHHLQATRLPACATGAAGAGAEARAQGGPCDHQAAARAKAALRAIHLIRHPPLFHASGLGLWARLQGTTVIAVQQHALPQGRFACRRPSGGKAQPGGKRHLRGLLLLLLLLLLPLQHGLQLLGLLPLLLCVLSARSSDGGSVAVAATPAAAAAAVVVGIVVHGLGGVKEALDDLT